MDIRLVPDQTLSEGEAATVTQSGAWYLGMPPKWEKDVKVLLSMFGYIREVVIEIRMNPKDLSRYNKNTLGERYGSLEFQYPISPEFD